MRNWIQAGIYTVGAAIIIGLIGLYVYHVWSDCLGENSVLTCARMLNK